MLTTFLAPGLVLVALAWNASSLKAITTAFGSDVKAVRVQAQRAEERGQWLEAAELYEQLLVQNRHSADIRNHYKNDLRRAQQSRRQIDPSYRQQCEHLSLDEALKVYDEVVTRLQQGYVERERAGAESLFREGVQELENALADPAFRRAYGLVSESALQKFSSSYLAPAKSQSIPRREDVPAKLRAIALAAGKSLGLAPTVVVLEFACGACAGLDEYTCYLTPAQFLEASNAWKGELATVPEPQFVDQRLGIGYFQITGFTESTAEEVDMAIAKLQAAGMKLLVLDLRGNMGGLFEGAVAVAERFLSSGVVAFTRGQTEESNVTYRARPISLLTVPLIVLIDSETASSAEMLAGALKENHRATLVGQTTFGKGTIQKTRKLHSAPAAIRMTMAKFYSPLGHPYAESGVTPDVVIDRPANVLELESDPQVQGALEVARPLLLGH